MDRQTPARTRRRLLASVAAGVAALAGCGGDDAGTTDAPETTTGTTADDTTTTGSGGGTATDDGTTDTTTTTETPMTELDLREANVTAVEFENRGGTEYRFDVTLHHDDDGEDGYANWWQVETLEGEQLGRRELLHAHGTREFTRSETIDVGETTCVVVRGHDQTHGYGGQAFVVNLDTEEMEAVAQGEEAADLASYEGVC